MDECLPRKLRKLLAPHHTRTVPEMGLAGLKNGALLRELTGKCRAFITIDSNISYQQNLPALPFASILLSAPSNRMTSANPGKLVAIISAPSTWTARSAANPITRNAIAMR